MTASHYARVGKRMLDLALASAGLIVVSPVLAAAALAVKLDSPGPVLFRQARLGRHGSLFSLLKLRTMTHVPRTPGGEVSLDNPEVTAVGRVLRRTKLDELPQLINVLRGEMSIVGPRPALPRMLEELDEVGLQRLRVRPGLTGLAQIRGNVHLSWPERWRYDAHYVETQSLATDLSIVLRTVPTVLLGEQRMLRRPAPSGVA